jgi:DNA/RNA-binding domain of Phe-tRNA-synthetase-like protein
MTKITISPELKDRCPKLRLACIRSEVKVAETPEGLLAEISFQTGQLRQVLTIEEISKIPAIEASRRAYKAYGKDPARYRLSAEALLRRVVSGKELYQISNVVDQLNLVSITSGFSIGGYDADQIQGDIIFGIGRSDEPYSGIGKGELNIANLPVFRDDLGAFGTPTSDSQRTEVTSQTKHFLMILIDFGGSDQLPEATSRAEELLNKYCQATNITNFNIE